MAGSKTPLGPATQSPRLRSCAQSLQGDASQEGRQGPAQRFPEGLEQRKETCPEAFLREDVVETPPSHARCQVVADVFCTEADQYSDAVAVPCPEYDQTFEVQHGHALR